MQELAFSKIATHIIFLAVVCMLLPSKVDRRLDNFPRAGRRSNVNNRQLIGLLLPIQSGD